MNLNGDVEMVDAESCERVAILDAGAQYGKVIDRRIRELNIESVILPLETSVAKLKKKNIKAIVVSGGPGSVYEENAPNWDVGLLDAGIPILGICYGMQLINRDCGGEVKQCVGREDGEAIVQVDQTSPMYRNLQVDQNVLLTHGDTCVKVGSSVKVNARCGEKIVGIEYGSKKIYGVQFHPEVDLTTNGKAMFLNFLVGICGLQQSFSLKSRESTCIDEIKGIVGNTNKVLKNIHSKNESIHK